VYVLGVRVHEWHLGAALLVALGVLAVKGVLADGLLAYFVGFVGCWLVAKDWRDLTGAQRDTAAWRLGFHRPPSAMRPCRRGDWVPKLSAIIVDASALASLVSALAPTLNLDGHVLRSLAIVQFAAVFHAAVVPVSCALLLASLYLWRRSERAWQIALGLMLILGATNLVMGTDLGEAALSFSAAGVLWWGRPSFTVRPERIPVRASLVGAAAVSLATLLVSTIAVWFAAHEPPNAMLVFRTTGDLLLWNQSPIAFRDDLGLLPEAIGLVSVLSLVAVARLVFRPLTPPLALPELAERNRAHDIVRDHGEDTLSYFKLRNDQQYLWSDDMTSFLGYRVENGVLLVSGDPVGDPRSVPSLIANALEHAETHSLRFAVVGASPSLAQLCRTAAGTRSLYIGDEGIVDTASFSLEGRGIRKVRQSVNRLERAGMRVQILQMRDAGEELLNELRSVSATWLQGGSERGFSMALDQLGGPRQGDSLLVVGTGPDDRVSGFLQLVPAHGGALMSLALMRRLPDGPNGLMEYLIVRAIEELRDRGVHQLSLNFAAFSRYLRCPANPAERLLASILRVGDRWFQIERLRTFNAKFSPFWQPRYLVYQSPTTLPRTALAVLWAEGQAPKMRLPRRAPAADSRSLTPSC
jgi:lysyl-tRNA synthetase class 2